MRVRRQQVGDPATGILADSGEEIGGSPGVTVTGHQQFETCLLYTSDAADDYLTV